jgi:hypothetical protein
LVSFPAISIRGFLGPAGQCGRISSCSLSVI